MSETKKPRFKFASKIVVVSVIAILAYTIAVFLLEYANIEHMTNIQLPTDLTVSWYAFWTVELVCLASIRKSKIKNKYEDPDLVSAPDMEEIMEMLEGSKSAASTETTTVTTTTTTETDTSEGPAATVSQAAHMSQDTR